MRNILSLYTFTLGYFWKRKLKLIQIEKYKDSNTIQSFNLTHIFFINIFIFALYIFLQDTMFLFIYFYTSNSSISNKNLNLDFFYIALKIYFHNINKYKIRICLEMLGCMQLFKSKCIHTNYFKLFLMLPGSCLIEWAVTLTIILAYTIFYDHTIFNTFATLRLTNKISLNW